MKGGLQWREGSDTCIFKPSVACLENPVKYPSDIPNRISRIVPSTEQDIENERLIRDNFPQLVKRGLVAVFEKDCTPSFLPSNLQQSPKIRPKGPCSRLPPAAQLTNMITREYTDTLNNYLYQFRPLWSEARKLIRGALCAAITMVPDNKVWVLHGDLHFGNVLMTFDPNTGNMSANDVTALADWGRMITFDSSNVDSIYTGLKKFLKLQSDKFGPFDTYMKLATDPEIITGKYTQYSLYTLFKCDAFMDAYELNVMNDNILKETLNTLRGFVPYIILTQLAGLYGYNKSWHDLFMLDSQNDLIKYINQNLPQINGEPYYNNQYIDGPQQTLVPSTPTPFVATTKKGLFGTTTANPYTSLSSPKSGGKRKSSKRGKKQRKIKSLKRRA